MFVATQNKSPFPQCALTISRTLSPPYRCHPPLTCHPQLMSPPPMDVTLRLPCAATAAAKHLNWPLWPNVQLLLSTDIPFRVNKTLLPLFQPRTPPFLSTKNNSFRHGAEKQTRRDFGDKERMDYPDPRDTGRKIGKKTLSLHN